MIDFNSLIFNDSGYADVVPSLVPNTTMTARINSTQDGLQSLQIKPIEGYVLHDKNYDEEILNEETLEPTGKIKLGYRTAQANMSARYGFTTSLVTDVSGNTVTAYGSREFYTLPKSDVPADNIYNNLNNH